MNTNPGSVADALKLIPGLEVDSALQRLGNNIKVYVKTLAVFVKTAGSSVDNLRGMLGSGDVAGYGVLVHGMKGALLNIGANELGERAKDLEFHAKDGDVIFITEHNEPLCVGILELEEALRPLLEQDTQGSKPPAPLQVLGEKIGQVESAMQDFDLDSALGVLAELKKQSFGAEADALVVKLYDAVELFDYDNALSLCSKITNMAGR